MTENDLKIAKLKDVMKSFMQDYKVQTDDAIRKALQKVWSVLNG